MGPRNYVALGTPTKGYPLGAYNRNIRESQRVKSLRSKLSPKEERHLQMSSVFLVVEPSKILFLI